MNADPARTSSTPATSPKALSSTFCPSERASLDRLGARFLSHSFDRRQRFLSEPMGSGQHTAGDLGLAEDRHYLRGNPGPTGTDFRVAERSNTRTGSPPRSRSRARKLTLGYDIANLVEAHAGAPQRLDVGASPSAIRPTAALQIVVRDVALGAR